MMKKLNKKEATLSKSSLFYGVTSYRYRFVVACNVCKVNDLYFFVCQSVKRKFFVTSREKTLSN